MDDTPIDRKVSELELADPAEAPEIAAALADALSELLDDDPDDTETPA